MGTLSAVALILAAASTGLIAGVLLAYNNSALLVVRAADDGDFAAACQRLSTVMNSPAFIGISKTGLLSTVAATALLIPAGDPAALAWTVAAQLLYTLTLVVNLRINVPMLKVLAAVDDQKTGNQIPPARVRFTHRWNRFYNLSTATTFGTFCCQLIALALSSG